MAIHEIGSDSVATSGDDVIVVADLIRIGLDALERQSGRRSARGTALFEVFRRVAEQYALTRREVSALLGSASGLADVREGNESTGLPQWVSVREAAERLGCTQRHVRRLAETEAVRATHDGPNSPWRIDAATLPLRLAVAG